MSQTKTDFRGSEVTDFLRCRKKYDYAWVQNLEPKQRDKKLTIGSAIHKFLEYYYISPIYPQVAVDTMLKYILDNSDGMDEFEFEEMNDLCLNIVTNYMKQWDLDFETYEVVATEMPFSVRLNADMVYTGTIDLLLKDRDGHIWLVDHKTTNAIDIYEKNSEMDRQISRYWAALELGGRKIHGFIYNIILKDYPVPPKVLKSGALSKDKSQKTTYELYSKAIVEHDLKEEDYADFLQLLQDQPKEFFRRTKVERSQAERDAAIAELEQVIEDIQINTERMVPKWYRNITKDCSWDCPFKSLCVAEMDGSNADHIRNELFQVKEEQE